MFFEPRYGVIKVNHVAHVFNMTKFGRPFRPEQWRHICYSAEINQDSQHLVVIMDGEVYLNDSCHSGYCVHSSLLLGQRMIDKFCIGNSNKARDKKMIGSITDVYIWSGTFAISYMKQFTQGMMIKRHDAYLVFNSMVPEFTCASPCIAREGKLRCTTDEC